MLNAYVCGNYCGPGWCGGASVLEENCLFLAQPTGCVDSCCADHDDCCANGVRPSCNADIVACIRQCSPLDQDCTWYGVPVLPTVIDAAMASVVVSECGDVGEVSIARAAAALLYDSLAIARERFLSLFRVLV